MREHGAFLATFYRRATDVLLKLIRKRWVLATTWQALSARINNKLSRFDYITSTAEGGVTYLVRRNKSSQMALSGLRDYVRDEGALDNKLFIHCSAYPTLWESSI